MGSNEGIHPIILPDIFSSGGSINVYIDKFGRVASIPGYTRQSAVLYWKAGGSNATIRGLISYRGTVGSSVSRKLIVFLDDEFANYDVQVSTDNGGTGTLLESIGATSLGFIPDGAQYGDTLYVTNGKMAVRKYDGTTWSTVALTQSPTATAAASASTGNLTGNYTYKLVSTFADRTRKAGSVASNVIQISAKKIDLTWTADANVSVTGYELYRTTGSGTTFYLVTSLTGRATAAYTDNTSDTTILENRVLEEHGDAPPSGAYFCENHKQRMWWLRTSASPTIAYYSDPGNPESVYAQNYLNFTDSENVGDVISGAIGNFDGQLVVFTEKSIWQVSGTGEVIGEITDWTKERSNAQTGAVGHRGIVRVPAGARYTDSTGALQSTSGATIAYVTPLGDVRLFDGVSDTIISTPLKDTIAGLNYTQRAKVHALNDIQNGQIIWFLPISSNLEPTIQVVWSYRHGVWYKWNHIDGFFVASSVEVDSASDPSIFIIGKGNQGGTTYNFLDTSTTADGSAFTSVWQTKALYGLGEANGPALSNTKRWRWVDMLFRVNQASTVSVSWSTGTAPDNATGLGTKTLTPAASVIYTGTTISDILTASGDRIIVGNTSVQGQVLLRTTAGDYLHDESLRLRISSTGSWALEAMNLAYQVLPGLHRRTNETGGTVVVTK